MKILVVGAGHFGPYSRDEVITEILKEYPEAEVVTQDAATPAQGMAYDFVAYDEAAKLPSPSFVQYIPPAPTTGLGFEKKGRRRGQRQQEYPWRRR